MSRSRGRRQLESGANLMSVNRFSSLSPGVNAQRYEQSQTGLAPFPFRWNARLTYGVNIAIGTPGALPYASKWRFRLNSCYDPDVTGTGDQPYQWDQLTNIYKNYIVKSARVEITFNEPSSAGCWVGWCYHSDTDTNDDPAGKGLEQLVSRPNFQCVPISDFGNQSVTLKVTIPIHEVFGLSASQYLNVTDQYGAAYNANPLSQAYLDLFFVDPNALGTVYVRAVGRIIYDVQLFGYQAPDAS